MSIVLPQVPFPYMYLDRGEYLLGTTIWIGDFGAFEGDQVVP
jgi:hypothetical protein